MQTRNNTVSWRAPLVAIFIYFYFLVGHGLIVGSAPIIRVGLDVLFFVVFPLIFLFLLLRVRDQQRLILIDAVTNRPMLSAPLGAVLGAALAFAVLSGSKFFQPTLSADSDFAGLVLRIFDVSGVFYLAGTAAVIEELFYKPILVMLLPVRLGGTMFSLFSGILYFGAHVKYGVEFAAAVSLPYGVLSAYYYQATNNLLLLIVMHFVADVIIFGVRLVNI